jgi:hypothetical protein
MRERARRGRRNLLARGEVAASQRRKAAPWGWPSGSSAFRYRAPVPLLPPRIGVPRADPAVVRRVRAEEAKAEACRVQAERERITGAEIAKRWREG